MHGLILAAHPQADVLVGRTERALRAAGVAVTRPALRGVAALAEALGGCVSPVLLAQAGAFLTHAGALPAIPPSATGKPLVAFGAVRAEPGGDPRWRREARAWQKLLRRTGGDLDRRAFFRRTLPETMCVYLEPAAAHRLACLLRGEGALSDALAGLMRDRRLRTVHLGVLDVYADDHLRVVQLITSIQLGGAERVALDLAAELLARGRRVCVAAFGQPMRAAFPVPPDFVDFSTVPNEPEARADAVAALCLRFGADVVHAHLIRGAEARAIKARGLPLAITVHNMPQAWPAGVAGRDPAKADLLLACSRAVETAVREQDLGVPVRVCWNGIAADSVAPSPERQRVGAALRATLGWGAHDFVLVCLANPRPQKRLERLPEIVHRLQARLPARTVRRLLAGEPAMWNREAAQAVADLDAAIVRWQVEDCVHRCGAVSDPAPLLAAADAYVSVSAFEGLSLAHLEALAAGLPLVATGVGGTGEIAAQTPAAHLLPANAEAGAFADVLARIAHEPGRAAREPALPPSFTRYRMAARAEWLYPCAIRRARPGSAGEGLWLVTNNFSTGGAQSSARRLLVGLARRGVKVRAAVVQEFAWHPTPGTEALRQVGVPVTAVPFDGREDAASEQIAADLLALLAADPPAVVVFWNLIPSCKVLLAEALPDAAVFDVSPGAMFFDSLERWFGQPPPGLPYRSPRDYGAQLDGVVVKYRAEAARAAEMLGAPVHVVPNGVPLLPLPLRASHRCLVIGTAARIAPAKRLEDLLAALRLAHDRLRPYRLRIAGGVERGAESYARDLRRMARGLPVEWTGESPDTSAFLASLDLFAMISDPPGCPNASLEAMASGLPVIATDVGGASEQVLDGHTGLLVPPRDAPAFAGALTELACDPAKRATLGAAARAHVAAHFSLDRMLDDYARLFALDCPASRTRTEASADC